MWVAALGGIALLLAGCGGASSAEPAPQPSPTGALAEGGAQGQAAEPETGRREATTRERHAIAQLEHVAEQVRGLTFARPVPVQIESADRISSHLTSQIEEDDIEEARIVYSALGLIARQTDLRDLLGRLVAEQVVGYYDPEDDRLVVRDDIMRALGGGSAGGGSAGGSSAGGGGTRDLGHARLVLVHELVHALQDQRLDLGASYDVERDTDADNAFRAVVEGDATLAMFGYAAAQAGGSLEMITAHPDRLRQMVNSTEALPGVELGNAPPIVRVTMIGSYLHGMVFAAELHRRGGWDAVDRAHKRRPVSTEQVMHPQAYVQDEAPDDLEIPELPELADAGLEVFEEDTLGELEMGVYLAQGRDKDVDAEAAAGWGGDRLRVYRDAQGAPAAVWLTSWDDPGEAKEAAMAAGRLLEDLSEDRRQTHRVERRGRAVLIVRDLPLALHSPVIQAFHQVADGL